MMFLLSVLPFFRLTSTPNTSLSTLSEVFQQMVQWVIDFLRLISTEPLLLIGLALVVVGIIAGLAFKMIRGRGKKGS